MTPLDCDMITNIEASSIQREVLDRWLTLSLPDEDEPIKDEIRAELKARDEAEAFLDAMANETERKAAA